MVCFSERLCKFDEKVSLSVEYIPLTKIIDVQTNDNSNSSLIFKSEYEFLTNIPNLSSLSFKKYFSCISQVHIKELRELLELDLGKNYTIYFVDPTLQTVLDDDLNLQDFIYIYTWNRRSSLNLFFTLIYASSLDEDKPPILEVEESIPQSNIEFSKILNQNQNQQNSDSTSLSSSSLMDSELTIPRLSVSLPSSAFNITSRDGVHQPIITALLPENNLSNKQSSTETSNNFSQQRKRKKISIKNNEKIKKYSKKQFLIINNSSSDSTQVSTTISTQNSNLELPIKLLKSSESKDDSLKIATSSQNFSLFNNNCTETLQKNDSLNDDQKSNIQLKNTSLNLKLPKSKILEQQSHQKLKRVQNRVVNSSTNNQNLSLINKLPNLSSIKNDNIFYQNLPSSQSSSKNLASNNTQLSSLPLTTTAGISLNTTQNSIINKVDFKSISPQQQEAAMRAYYQFMKLSKNNDAMSAFLAASNTTNSTGFNNFYNVIAAAASNQLFAALYNNVTPKLSLPLNKNSESNLFSVDNVLNNEKSINCTGNLTDKIKQKTEQKEQQQTHLNCEKEAVISNDNKIQKLKNDDIIISNSPSTSNKVVSMINIQKFMNKEHQNKNSKTSFYDTSLNRLSKIGASPMLSATTNCN